MAAWPKRSAMPGPGVMVRTAMRGGAAAATGASATSAATASARVIGSDEPLGHGDDVARLERHVLDLPLDDVLHPRLQHLLLPVLDAHDGGAVAVGEGREAAGVGDGVDH